MTAGKDKGRRNTAKAHTRDLRADPKKKARDEEREKLQQRTSPPFGKRKVPEPPE